METFLYVLAALVFGWLACAACRSRVCCGRKAGAVTVEGWNARLAAFRSRKRGA